MALDDIEEGSSCSIDIDFTDEDGDPVAPTGATYRIEDEKSGEEILAETQIGDLAESITLAITPEQNAILDETHPHEIRRLTLGFDYGEGKHHNQGYRYLVKNLMGVSSPAEEG